MAKTKITHITPKGNSVGTAFSELYRNFGLVGSFTYRDLKVRYVQTYLGYLWSLIQPVFGLAAVFVLFYKMAGINAGEVPYLAFALSGLIFWNYFTYVVTQTASSFVNMQAMIKKIYFPRLSIPLSKAIVGMVDLAVGTAILLGILAYYELPLASMLSLPLVLLTTATAALGLGLVVSALSIRYRDLQQVLPFALQILFFLTPVAYPTTLFADIIPSSWMWVAYLNPMTGILELFRYFLFGSQLTQLVWVSLSVSVALFVAGLVLFTRTDKKMADLV